METVQARKRPFWDTGIVVRVTNLGLGFVLTTLVVAVGATNTGNNGLYLLLALLLGALVVSGFVSRRNVEELSASLEGPEEVFAGEPARFTVRLASQSRSEKVALLVKVSGKAAPLLFPRVARGEVARRGVDLVFPRRGTHRLESLLVFSSYPIGLFRKGRLHRIEDERLVFPLPLLPGELAPEPSARGGETVDPRRRGRSAEVKKLRDAAPGDEPRDIHWRQTARQGRPIVKERASELGRDVVVWLDTAVPGGDAFERSVREAAGLALRSLARGDRTGLAAGERFVPPATGPGQRRRLLTALAFVAAGEEPGPAPMPPSALVYRVRAGT